MSEHPDNASASADDFIHVSLERSTNTSLSDSLNSTKSQYSQVVFHDLSEVYPTDGDVCFSYSFQPGVIPQISDRIALYKVGWSSVSEFITSVFVNPEEVSISSKICQATFPVENLPKDEINMYQFCYITSGNIVAGSSIPFTFRKPHGNELVAVEDPNDSGLVVFRSRVTQLQEQLFKSNAIKEALEKTIQELQSELYFVKAEITEKVQKCNLHEENIHDMTAVIYDLNTEKKALMEKNQRYEEVQKQFEELQKVKESLENNIALLESQILSYKNDLTIKDTTIKNLNEKLEKNIQSGHQVKDLLKNKESLQNNIISLMGKIESHKSDIAAKDATIKDLNEGKKIYEEQIKSLTYDLGESTNSLDQLTNAMNVREKDMEDKFEKLNKKLKEMNSSMNRDLEKANHQVKSLTEIIKSKDKTLSDYLGSSNDSTNLKTRLITTEDDITLLQVQLFSLEEKIQSCELENVQLKEENGELKREKLAMVEQLSRMNEELRNLKRNFNCHSRTHFSESRRGSRSNSDSNPGPEFSKTSFSSRHKKPSAFAHLSTFIPFFSNLQDGATEDIANAAASSPASTSKISDCEKCQDSNIKVKSLMVEKADIRSDLIQTKHSNEEYCRLLREVNEEAAALKSRIAVLEIELRKAKEVSITNQGEQKFKHMYDTISNSWKESDSVMECSSEYKPSDEKLQELRESLQKEMETKAILQRNVEALMISESGNLVTIDKLKKENVKLTTELSQIKDSLATVDEMRKALDDMDSSKIEMTKNIKLINTEKSKLETQLIELRKESVGKVSLTTAQQLRDENEELKKQLNNQECCKKLKEKLEAIGEAAGLSIGRITQQHQLQSGEGWSMIPSAPPESAPLGNPFVCPLCMVTFPPDSADAYNKHFSDHID